jgi:hypothetical protein
LRLFAPIATDHRTILATRPGRSANAPRSLIELAVGSGAPRRRGRPWQQAAVRPHGVSGTRFARTALTRGDARAALPRHPSQAPASCSLLIRQEAGGGTRAVTTACSRTDQFKLRLWQQVLSRATSARPTIAPACRCADAVHVRPDRNVQKSSTDASAHWRCPGTFCRKIGTDGWAVSVTQSLRLFRSGQRFHHQSIFIIADMRRRDRLPPGEREAKSCLPQQTNIFWRRVLTTKAATRAMRKRGVPVLRYAAARQ